MIKWSCVCALLIVFGVKTDNYQLSTDNYLINLIDIDGFNSKIMKLQPLKGMHFTYISTKMEVFLSTI